jgi:hypothetical protein
MATKVELTEALKAQIISWIDQNIDDYSPTFFNSHHRAHKAFEWHFYQKFVPNFTDWKDVDLRSKFHKFYFEEYRNSKFFTSNWKYAE